MPRKLSNTYGAIHQWVRLNWGKPNYCETCKHGKGSRFEWALRPQKDPSRNREDWLRLCSKCHRVMDMTGRIPWNKGIKGMQNWHNISGLNNGIPWNMGRKTKKYVTCRCGKMFYPPKRTSKFCSKSCAMKRNKHAVHLIKERLGGV